MSKEKTRLVLPDVLKGLAVVLMIQVHVMEQLVNPDLFESTFGKISLFLGGVPAAPVFMIVMGYFVGFTKAKPLRMMRRGLFLFGGGILLNILLNLSYIIGFIKTAYPDLVPGSIFGVDILPLAGMSLIIIGGLRRISGHPLFLIAIALLVAGLTPWINQMIDAWDTARYVTAFFGGTAEWSYFPLFPWLAYPLTGLALHAYGLQKWKLIPAWGKGLIMGISLVGFVFGLKMGFNMSTILQEYYHHNIVFYLWALSFMILLVYSLSLMNFESQPLRVAFLSFMGREVTLVYVIQWILIGNLAAWLGKETLFVGHLAWTLSFVLVSALLAYVYRKKLSNK